MPGFTRTGPMGAGPMTGGARGFCNPANAGYQTPVYGGLGYGRGGGFGRGYGRGSGRGFMSNLPAYAAPYGMDSASELELLKSQADSFRNALDSIQHRIADLEKTNS
jgi:hypothetical protein